MFGEGVVIMRFGAKCTTASTPADQLVDQIQIAMSPCTKSMRSPPARGTRGSRIGQASRTVTVVSGRSATVCGRIRTDEPGPPVTSSRTPRPYVARRRVLTGHPKSRRRRVVSTAATSEPHPIVALCDFDLITFRCNQGASPLVAGKARSGVDFQQPTELGVAIVNKFE